MKVFIVGGTGFLGYYAVQDFLKNGWEVATISLPPMPSKDLLPEGVECTLGDINDFTDQQLLEMFEGCDAFVYAAGQDERVVPKAPAYEFFRKANVDDCVRLLKLAKEAGVKKSVVLNSYFAYFAELWPEFNMEKHHPYVRSRLEQARESIAVGGDGMDVMILQLPYIFGTMPGRIPLWKFLTDMWKENNSVFYYKGGTACITAKQVAQATSGAIKYGEHGKKYAIGGVNLTWKELYGKMLEYTGWDMKMKKIPAILMKLGGYSSIKKQKKEGTESGAHPVKFIDIYTSFTYIDPKPAMDALKYEEDDLFAALKETMELCVK